MNSTPFVQTILRWWWLPLLGTLLGFAVGYAISRITPPIYRAATTLLVTPERPSGNDVQLLGADQRGSLVATYKELLLKRPVIDRVIASQNLVVDPTELRERLSISEVRNTQILILSAEAAAPEEAALLANAIVQSFQNQAADLLANPRAANWPGLSVVEPATPPIEPEGTGLLRNLILSGTAGLLLAMGMVLTIEYLDTRVRTRRDAEQLAGTRVVAEVPRLRGLRARDRLVTLRAAQTPDAELFRMLRLPIAGGAAPLRSLVVSSPRPREGKTTIAANLAIAMAQTGLRTLLIDANLRRPQMHELFDQPNTRGITTALRQEEQGTAATHTVDSGIANLTLLLSGPVIDITPANLAHLLAVKHMQPLMAELQPQFDIVIFDSPSLLDAIETALLAQSCDGLLLVVRAGQTRADALVHACEMVEATRLLGVVLNQAPRAAATAPGNYYLRHGPRLQRALTGGTQGSEGETTPSTRIRKIG